MPSRLLSSRFVRPTLEALEERDLPSGTAGILLTQPLGQLATQMNNSLTVLRSDIGNLSKDLSGHVNPVTGVFSGASVDVALTDYIKSGFDLGQVQGFEQGINAVGKADLAFIAFSAANSSQGNSALLPLLSISSDLNKANKTLSQALAFANKNPPNVVMAAGAVSVLTAISS